MTRGNQREKAREKNLKDAAGSVSGAELMMTLCNSEAAIFTRNLESVESSY